MPCDFGKRIQKLCNYYKISQKELARRSGISESSISLYISGSRTPRCSVLLKMADTLHTTPDYLLYGAENGNELYLDSNDFDIMCHKIQRLVSKYASQMTQKQKNAIIMTILETNEA